MNDLYAGNIAFAHLDATTTIGTMKQGKMRLLAASTKERAKAFPDVPSAHEAGIDNSDLSGWWSIATPKGTPQPIRERLEKIYTDFVAGDDHSKWVLSIWLRTLPGQRRLRHRRARERDQGVAGVRPDCEDRTDLARD